MSDDKIIFGDKRKTFDEQFQDALNDSPAAAERRGFNSALDAVLEILRPHCVWRKDSAGPPYQEFDMDAGELIEKIEQLRAEKEGGGECP